VTWGGQFENLERARHRLTVILPITVAIIFALLFFMFGSTRDAGLVLMNVPFSLVGGILALYVRGINLSVSAAVGFISLFGVAVMSGVLVVAEINRRRVEDETEPLDDAVVHGRLSPSATSPDDGRRSTSRHDPGGTCHRDRLRCPTPLATVLVGGLLSTLVLTLVALPSLYALVVGRRRLQKSTADTVSEATDVASHMHTHINH
jgi:cobalt-zinc-cadmium resistance protein CzcA